MCHVERPDSFSCFEECLLSSDSREYLKPAEIFRFGRFYLSNGVAYFSNWPISLKQKAFCENFEFSEDIICVRLLVFI